jgi:hypothetical protein
MNPPKKSATFYCNVSSRQSVLSIQPERLDRKGRKGEIGMFGFDFLGDQLVPLVADD